MRDARPLPVWLCLLLLTLLCAMLYGYAIYRTPFRGLYDDVNRSLIARAMADTDEWAVPHFLGRPIYTKPPLMYWVAGALYEWTGRRDELPAALASVLSHFLAVLATFWAGSVLVGRRAGLRAAAILATTYLFLMMGRQPLIDTVMMAGFGLAFAAAAQGALAPGQLGFLWWGLTGLGLGLATLTKGPVVLPVFLILIAGVWRPAWPGARSLAGALLVLAVIAAVVLPWHLQLLQRETGAAEVLRVELLGRFADENPFHDWTQKPVWFYVPDLVNTLPWLPLLPAGLIFAWHRRRERPFRMLLLWAVGGFLFFSLSSASKRSYYLLPIYPALALLCGAVWNTARETARRGLPGWAAAGSRSAGDPDAPPPDYVLDEPPEEDLLDLGADSLPRRTVLAGSLLTAAVLILAGLVTIAAPWRCALASRALFGLAGAGAVGFGAFAVRRILRLRWRRAFSALVIALCLVYLPFLGRYIPKLHHYHSGRMFWHTAAEVLARDEAPPPLLAVVRHDDRPFAAFYMDREDVVILEPAEVARRTDERLGGYVMAKPEAVAGIPDLRPVLLHTLRAPCGRLRQLALFAIPGPDDPAPPSREAPPEAPAPETPAAAE